MTLLIENLYNSISKKLDRDYGWWSEGLISDEDFANGIQYLMQQGIVISNPIRNYCVLRRFLT